MLYSIGSKAGLNGSAKQRMAWVNIKKKILAKLRNCAHSCSEEQFEIVLESLTNSVEWITNARLRNWFTKTWLSEKKVIISLWAHLSFSVHLSFLCLSVCPFVRPSVHFSHFQNHFTNFHQISYKKSSVEEDSRLFK